MVLAFQMNVLAQTFEARGGIISDQVGAEVIPSYFQIPVTLEQKSITSTYGIEKVCLHIRHQRPTDLKVELLSPTGTNVWLTNRNGNNNTYGYFNTCFAQFGFNGPIHEGEHIFEGEYTAEGRMDFFNNGQNPNGTWLLVITDVKNGIVGKLEDFSLTFGSNAASLRKSPCTTTSCTHCQSSDPEGVLMPDLIVSENLTIDNIQYFDNDHPDYSNQLRFAAAMANIGEGPLEIITTENWYCQNTIVDKNDVCDDGSSPTNNVQQILYRKGSNGSIRYDTIKSGTLYFDDKPGHNHYHVKNWANFKLLKKKWWTNNPDCWKVIAESAKVSYCLFDNMICSNENQYCEVQDKVYAYDNLNNYGLGNYSSCDSQKQGISVGGIDYYGINYEGQHIDLPQDIKSGNYYLLIEVDPSDEYRETNENNNSIVVPIKILKE